MRAFSRAAGLFILFTALAFAYIGPAGRALLTRSRTVMIGADGDARALPYLYDQYARTFKTHPSRFLYGAIYVDTNAPNDEGLVAWVSLVERWAVVGLNLILPNEQIVTAFVLLLMIANASAMFILVRTLFGRPTARAPREFVVDAVAVALAVAWGFSPYTIARAQVHPAFVGVYHVPLIFLGLLLAARARGGAAGRLLLGAAACFVLAVTVAQYYVVTAAALSPFFLLFFITRREVAGRRSRALAGLVVAALPAVLLLGWNLTHPLPPDVRPPRAGAFPKTGELKKGQTYHPYLETFSARPLDYLAGDLWPGTWDPNPARAWVNRAVTDDIARGGRGNAHERTNGVRWSILLLAVVALARAFGRRTKIAEARLDVWVLALVTVGGLWISLAPPAAAPWLGASYWIGRALPQLRVPSRAGIYVNFGLLLIAGSFVSAWLRSLKDPRRRVCLAALLPVAMVLDYPPFVNSPRVTDIPAPVAALAREQGPCGAGLFFPFASPLDAETEYLNFLMLTRGSDCTILNANRNERRAEFLSEHLPPTSRAVDHLNPTAKVTAELIKIARCVPLTWIIFDDRTPPAWRRQTCKRLRWTWRGEVTCVSPTKGARVKIEPDAC